MREKIERVDKNLRVTSPGERTHKRVGSNSLNGEHISFPTKPHYGAILFEAIFCSLMWINITFVLINPASKVYARAGGGHFSFRARAFSDCGAKFRPFDTDQHTRMISLVLFSLFRPALFCYYVILMNSQPRALDCNYHWANILLLWHIPARARALSKLFCSPTHAGEACASRSRGKQWIWSAQEMSFPFFCFTSFVAIILCSTLTLCGLSNS